MKECEKKEERKNRKLKVVVSSYCCVWELKRKGRWGGLKVEIMEECEKEEERKTGRKNRRMEKYM